MRTHRKKASRERGSALLCTLVLVVSCAALGAAMIRKNVAVKVEYDARWNSAQRLYLARAGIASALIDLRQGNSGALGSAGAPVSYGDGAYYVETTTNADGTISLTSHGRFAGEWRTVRGIVRDVAVPVFDHAMYAGNSSGDPNYRMTFAGNGAQADTINGDIYSGGGITVGGQAVVNGSLRASGMIAGASGTSGITQPGPDLSAMHYETNHDVNVAAEFAPITTRTANALGGSAYQVPQSNRAHIFRKNPTDRATACNGTTKDDYFLEDPYQPRSTSSTVSAAAATVIQLNDPAVGSPNSGNRLTYYVDGNLWVHSVPCYSFTIKHSDPDGVQVTFVVKGNIYYSDNIIRRNDAKDAFAFIALKDPAVPDSGNIYFGDASFGTLERMDAFMYAENNFHDVNLNAGGSSRVIVNGTMSAGNQIAIQRDYGSSHTRLELNFDSRLKTGALNLPNLPALLGNGGGGADFRLASMIAIGR